MNGLVPYVSAPYEQQGFLPSPEQIDEQDLIQGVCLVLAPEQQDGFLHQLEQWFAERDEVVLVGCGTSAKQGQGFLLLEWEGYPIDPLFLAIVRHEPLIDDYWVYTRNREI